MKNDSYHAWYSHSAALLWGSIFYLNEAGEEVEITAISKDVNFSYEWPDKVYRGKVGKFIRKGQQGLFNREPKTSQDC